MIAFADLLQLEWRNPWWWLVALQPLLVAALLRLRRNRVLHYADAHLLPWAISSHAAASESKVRRAANALLWLLLACALAGPRLPLPGGNEGQRLTMPRHDMDLMVVLDVSPSMRARDGTDQAAPDRLGRAKLKLLDLRRRLRGERLGLIAFSGEAGLLMPPTRDADLLEHYLALAQPELFEEAGTQLAVALGLALAQREGERSQAVLLVTDGEASALSGESGNAALAAARALKTAKVPLYVLALGSVDGAPIPLPEGGVVEENGTPVISRLDAAGFGSLAASTGGHFATVSSDDGDLASLYDRGILTLRAATPRKDSARGWRELYAFALVPALLLFLLLGVRKRAAALVTLSLAAAGTSAAEPDAYQRYLRQDYLLAQQLYAQQDGWIARMGEGASAYRRKDYGYAVKQFSEALLIARSPNERADALFNLGNSYYLAGNKTAALDALQGVLRYRDDAKARANLARVTAQMKAAPAPAGEGVGGRRGRGLGEGDNAGGDAPMGMEPEKESAQVLQEETGSDGDAARGGRSTRSASFDARADVRAAQKKLELVRDQPAQLAKRLLTQDRSPEATGAQRPW